MQKREHARLERGNGRACFPSRRTGISCVQTQLNPKRLYPFPFAWPVLSTHNWWCVVRPSRSYIPAWYCIFTYTHHWSREEGETPPHPHLCVLLSLPSTHIRPRWSAHFRWWAPIPCCERLLCYLFSLVAIMSPAPPSSPLLGSLQLNRYKSGSFKLS